MKAPRDGSPRVDLHRHLEGSVRPSTYVELAERAGLVVETDRAGWPTAISLDGPAGGLVPYLDRIEQAVSVCSSLEDVRRLVVEAVEDAHAEGLDHLELRFSPRFIAALNGLAPADVADAVIDGADKGRASTGLSVSLIGILSRTFGPEATGEELEAILVHRDHVQGIDLAGDEKGWPCSLFSEQIDRARSAGLRVTVHAGEGAGPESVWEAIDHLRPERIGHGVRSVEDPQLCEHLARSGVVLEVAITSNVHTNTSASAASHQLSRLAAAGVPVTLNTDNPTVSRTTLSRELDAAADAVGLTSAQLRQAAETAVDAAFVDSETKSRLRTLTRHGRDWPS